LGDYLGRIGCEYQVGERSGPAKKAEVLVRKALRFVIADMGAPLLDAEPVFDLPAAIIMERPGRRRFHCNPSIVL
jgi:hypothetical protein